MNNHFLFHKNTSLLSQQELMKPSYGKCNSYIYLYYILWISQTGCIRYQMKTTYVIIRFVLKPMLTLPRTFIILVTNFRCYKVKRSSVARISNPGHLACAASVLPLRWLQQTDGHQSRQSFICTAGITTCAPCICFYCRITSEKN